MRKTLLLLLIAAGCSSLGLAQQRADWMRTARWGVMSHFLADWIATESKEPMTVERWNQIIDRFDVDTLARQLQSVGAGYYLITIGQNSGYYLSPNATYDKLVGISPSKCSRRDLVADLYDALSKRGVKLMVYLPSGAPGSDRVAREKLQWENGPHRNREFQLMWEQVMREWAKRWGTKIMGWWFDGCYWPNTMYRTKDTPNFDTFIAAARSGNPNAVVGFNYGTVVRPVSLTPEEDYIAGEVRDPAQMDLRRVYDGRIDGAQLHLLTYLGGTWGRGEPRFKTEEVVKWTTHYISNQGAVTWDTPLQQNGTIAPVFLEQLAAVGKATAR